MLRTLRRTLAALALLSSVHQCTPVVCTDQPGSCETEVYPSNTGWAAQPEGPIGSR